MFEVFQVISVNYQRSCDTVILEHYSTKEKALDYCKKELIRITPRSQTDLLVADTVVTSTNADKFPYTRYERFEYQSHYGDYPCALIIKSIFVH